MPPHTLFCTARAENTFDTVTLCNLSDSQMHYRRSCLQHFANPMFSRLAVLIIHRKIGQWLFSNGICFSQQPLHHAPCALANRFLFQLTVARRRLPGLGGNPCYSARFQLTAARRRLRPDNANRHQRLQVSTHSRSKAAAGCETTGGVVFPVSTHSRSKAAAHAFAARFIPRTCFNSQPPEGDCNQILPSQHRR